MMTPYADDAASLRIGGLTIENGTDTVALYGSLDLTRDQAGLGHARDLLAILQAAVQRLEAEAHLPAALPANRKPRTSPNPFT